ncbi:MAG: aminoacyl-tRNA hydrolase [Deltaproteobacteria bacterium]|jgi:ribosome-associated protein|nr:aminoacyl-tRNA hydrolase [Deltaproteobacteria bacterium]
MSDLRVSRGLVIPAGELHATASRSSGPGGQHVNKSSTRVTLRWNIEASEALSDRQRALLLSRLDHRLTRGGELVLHAGRARSRARNLENARERLAKIVSGGLATTRKRIATRASAGARKRRVEQKKRRSSIKSQRRRPELDD